MHAYKKLLCHVRNVWLLLLPIAAFASWLMQEIPVAREAVSTHSAARKNTHNNFYQLEQLLVQLYVTDENKPENKLEDKSANKLVIDTQAEKYLSQAVNNFGVEFDQKRFDKSFPSSQGKKLGQLLDCYAAYKRAEQQIGQSYLSTLTSEQQLDYRALQNLFFGDIAKKLFADHQQFYQSVEIAGVQLISPTLVDVTVAAACAELREVAND